MSDRYWDGGVDSGFDDVNNWSDTDGGATPASSVPGTGDHAHFTANGDGNACDFESNTALGELTVLVGYTSKIDLVTYSLTMDSGGDVTLDGGGEFDCGTGSHSLTAGTLDNRDQVTFVAATSTFTLNGACTMIGDVANDYFNLTFASSSTVTISASTITRIDSRGVCTINGAVVLGSVLAAVLEGQFVINAGASFSGDDIVSKYLYLIATKTGKGLTALHSSVTMPNTRVFSSNAGVVLAPGTWGGLLYVISSGGTETILTLSSGTYNFNGGIELNAASAVNVTLDSSTNGPIVNCASLTFDIDSTGDCVIDNSGAAVEWTITGDVIYDVSGGGALAWIKGIGTIELSGSADQDVDFNDESIEAITVDKSAGDVTLDAGFTTASFTGTSTGTGDFDPNGKTIEITGNCSWAAAFTMEAGAASMDASTWTVGGNFTANGQTLNATAAWTLSVTGTAVASGTGDVAYCNASGGTQIDASSGPWVNSQENINWKFAAFVSNINIGGIVVDDEHKYIQLLPKQHAEILI